MNHESHSESIVVTLCLPGTYGWIEVGVGQDRLNLGQESMQLPTLMGSFHSGGSHVAGLYWGIYWDYVGVMENKMETTTFTASCAPRRSVVLRLNDPHGYSICPLKQSSFSKPIFELLFVCAWLRLFFAAEQRATPRLLRQIVNQGLRLGKPRCHKTPASHLKHESRASAPSLSGSRQC